MEKKLKIIGSLLPLVFLLFLTGCASFHLNSPQVKKMETPKSQGEKVKISISFARVPDDGSWFYADISEPDLKSLKFDSQIDQLKTSLEKSGLFEIVDNADLELKFVKQTMTTGMTSLFLSMFTLAIIPGYFTLDSRVDVFVYQKEKLIKHYTYEDRLHLLNTIFAFFNNNCTRYPAHKTCWKPEDNKLNNLVADFYKDVSSNMK
jgi:hypothetical protein